MFNFQVHSIQSVQGARRKEKLRTYFELFPKPLMCVWKLTYVHASLVKLKDEYLLTFKSCPLLSRQLRTLSQ